MNLEKLSVKYVLKNIENLHENSTMKYMDQSILKVNFIALFINPACHTISGLLLLTDMVQCISK